MFLLADGGNAATPPVPAPAAAVPAPAATGAQGGGQAPGGGSNAANASSRSALLAGLLGRTQALLQQQGDPLLSVSCSQAAQLVTEPSELLVGCVDLWVLQPVGSGGLFVAFFQLLDLSQSL